MKVKYDFFISTNLLTGEKKIDNKKFKGQIDLDKKEILINASLTSTGKVTTIIHELLHYFNHILFFKIDKNCFFDNLLDYPQDVIKMLII
jgi:Zn-dependent peptidase ImmA (M78 family)